jgi:acetyl esterase
VAARAGLDYPNSRTPPTSPDWTLVYDGDCGFCLRCVAILKRWDRAQRLASVPFQNRAALDALPATLGRADLETAMHLVRADGRVFVGAAATPPLLRLLPGGGVLAALFALPGVPGVARAVYRRVARNRHRLFCGSAACRRGG